MLEAHKRLTAAATAFMRVVAGIPFSRAEEWLRDRMEHDVELAAGLVPAGIDCTATAFQELTDRGKREIEIACSCVEGALQATGYVYIAEDGSSEIDDDVKIELLT
jgi:hypothetical protein